MKYQMLVLDVDGTLMNSNNEISPRTLRSLARLQEHGGKVVLSSGRPTIGVKPLAELLQLPSYGSFVLSFNGSRIINCGTNECIYARNLELQTVYDLYRHAVGHGFTILTYSDTEIFSSPDPDKNADIEANANKAVIRVLDGFEGHIDFPVPKCLIIGDPEKLVLYERELYEMYHGLLSVSRSFPFFLEVNPKDVNKGNSLLRLLNGLDMNPEQVICCGDGGNDIPMIRSAGLGVAMANAGSSVKAAADYITASNDEDGIALVIERFIL